MTKVIALYLPQFHTIPENDQWWGKGFTEWTNVKKAQPLFKQHNQPRIPLNHNYYDLSTTGEMIRQAKLAKESCIDGFCYYHYWFKGKQLLQKPLELMLADRTVDIPFFFSWANEPWTRTWSGMNREVLLPQEYGTEDDWMNHINYLLPFFKDERYIKIDNKPVFLIYRTENFPHFDAMITLWESTLKEAGFNGIYLIETLNVYQSEAKCTKSSALLHFEPGFTFNAGFSKLERAFRKAKRIITGNPLIEHNYTDIWKRILRRNDKADSHKKIFKGGFVDWDNTARKGKKGVVIKGANPTEFGHFFSQLYKAAKANNDAFIFLNAWNEWAEGAYLEPDEKFQYGYLDQIKTIVERTNPNIQLESLKRQD